MPDPKKLPARTRICSQRAVKAALAVTVEAQETFRARLASLESIRDPATMAQALRVIIGESKEPRHIDLASARLSAVQGEAGELAKRRGDSLAVEALRAFEPTLAPLIDAAEQAFNELVAEALQAERALFAEFGEEHEPTAITRRLKACGEQIQSFRNALICDTHQPALAHGGAFSHIVEWFVVKS